MSRRPARRRAGIAAPACAALLCAAALLLYQRLGGDAQVSALLDALSASRPFIASSLALETGILPATDRLLPSTPAAQAVQTAEASPPAAETAAESAPPAAAAADPAAPDIPPQSGRAETVTLRNDANLTVDPDAMLRDPFPIRVQGDGPQVLVYHTHSTEAYTPEEGASYQPSGSYRTRDPAYNVIRVGDELCRTLEACGIRTVHITDIFDDPEYNGSYGRSLAAARAALAQHPSIQVTIDVHRDSILTDDGRQYRIATELAGQQVAQMMLVVGTDASGLTHPNWRRNLNFAVNLQADLNGAYPDLMRPVNLRSQRFNGHLRDGSLLLEVGSSGNTLPEALAAVRLFGRTLAARITAA